MARSDKSKQKDGALTLLQDRHFQEKNPWNNPVVGWLKTSQGVGGLVNRRGFAMLRVVLEKLMEGKMESLYDQPFIIENPGAIIIVTTPDGKIGLLQNFRMIGERLLPEAGANYISRLDDEKLWEDLLGSLGQWSWEAPRGLIPAENDDDVDFNEFVIKSAQLEALEEAGFTVEKAKIAGKININTTFFAHPQYVVSAQIKSVGESKPENLEILGKVEFFTTEELKKLNEEGVFVDGLTLSALALCGICL